MIVYYHFNGEIIPREKAALPFDDIAILRGYGLFDFFLVRNGVPLFYDDYIDRLERSASLLNLTVPFDRHLLRQHIHALIAANGLPDAGLKLVLTGGCSSDGYTPAQPNLLILESPLPAYPLQKYEQGVSLMLHEFLRPAPAVKSINYLEGIRLLPHMREEGAEDILFHHNGKILETTRANFFIVQKNQTIVTPRENVLEGITRRKTLEIARDHYPVAVHDLTHRMLAEAAEAFITSSTKQIMPVVRVGQQIIGEGRPGQVTRHLMQLFENLTLRYIAQNRSSTGIHHQIT